MKLFLMNSNQRNQMALEFIQNTWRILLSSTPLKNKVLSYCIIFGTFLLFQSELCQISRWQCNRVVQKSIFLSNSKIDGCHKIFSLGLLKALEKSVFLENWCMFSFGLFALKFQQITFLRKCRFMTFWVTLELIDMILKNRVQSYFL